MLDRHPRHAENAWPVTKSLAKASITMAPVDLWHARLAIKTLRKDQREAIAEVAESWRAVTPGVTPKPILAKKIQ